MQAERLDSPVQLGQGGPGLLEEVRGLTGQVTAGVRCLDRPRRGRDRDPSGVQPVGHRRVGRTGLLQGSAGVLQEPAYGDHCVRELFRRPVQRLGGVTGDRLLGIAVEVAG